MADQFPEEFGKYKIIEEVGRGGFAAVYKAVDTTLDRTVALKVLAPHLLWDPAFVQRFQREAKLAANLKHPNVVIIYEFGQEAGTIYIAMEFLAGQTLKEVILKEGALPPARIVNMVGQIASALDYAHGRELVHRDIKPSNIMVGADDHVTVMDFGIAKAATLTALTTAGRIFGTPEYMSPEQAEGVEEPDARSDVYSLGVVVYEMSTGKVPFSGMTPLSIMRGHTDKSPPLPSEINPDVSPAVEALLLKALAKKREERYQSAGEMAVAFQQAVSGPVVEEIKKLPPKPELELHPSLALQLSVKPRTMDADGEATWTVTLRNDGDDDLRQVTVRRGRTLLDEPFDLAAGKGRRFTFTTTYETEGKKTEKVTVTGIASNGERVRDEVSVSVQVRPPRPVTPKPEPVPRHKPPAKPTPDVLTITSPIHLELVRVPAGEFLMGSDPATDKDAFDDEQPQHRVYVSEFYIGKYPVTNAQYEVFVRATGHEEPRHWTRLLRKPKVPSGKENHPVVWVSWHDAVAFCQWLSRETGKPFRLPTEAEWEKAARGTDGRKYPWGNRFDKTKLNSREGEPGDTTPVGQYSLDGDSPYGCADMSGNVWEWCADWFDEQEYQHRKSVVKDPQGPKKGTVRVLRGGAFYASRRLVRCAYRLSVGPDGRLRLYGLRVVVSPVPSDL